MSFRVRMVSGDEKETQVFTEALHCGPRIIFKFVLNPTFPQGVGNRVVTCFHDLPVRDDETFLDRDLMREAIRSSITQVWDSCRTDPSITAPNVTVEIYEDNERQIRWRICYESSYNQYLDALLPIYSPDLDGLAKPHDRLEYVDYSTLTQVDYLGGRGRTTIVRKSPDSKDLHVFKGVDFGAFLEDCTGFGTHRDIFYNAIRTLSLLPDHPNICPAPTTFVTMKPLGDNQHALICGTLYPYLKRGSLDDQIEHARATGVRLALVDKLKWCTQMVSAVAHTHFIGRTYHMDIKPANFLLDENNNTVLIDWEQSGAPRCTLAPEADGSWDVVSVDMMPQSSKRSGSTKSRPVYKKYVGPDRQNLLFGWPRWNVFPIWRDSCPQALHAVEVFSLGRTIWMLLEEVLESEVKDLDEVIVNWSEKSRDIPGEWKIIVDSCLYSDPNSRISLSELDHYWRVDGSKALAPNLS